MPGPKKTARRVPAYEQIIAMDDDKINVLVLGASGCGKSTLINAILEADEAPTGDEEAANKELAVYQNDDLPFRMIDTISYEYGIFKHNHIKRNLARFSREGVRSKDAEKLIHMIWFCIDSTTKQIDKEALRAVRSVANDWKRVPVIVVLTKSYSAAEIDDNKQMVKMALFKYNLNYPRRPLQIKAIIPVVAKEFRIDETITVPPMGLDSLVSKTVELVPEARKIGESSIREIDIKLKNAMANALIGSAAAGAVAVGAIPLPLPDATVLVPIQSAMLTGVAKIYGIRDDELMNEVVNTIIKVGATTIAGRTLLNALKGIPGLNVAAAVLNAAVAGSVTLIAGEVSNVLFQKVYNNELELNSIDWEKEITKLFENYLPGVADALKKIFKDSKGKVDVESVGRAIRIIAKLLRKK